MTRSVDLNSDLGEAFGAWGMGDDAAMLRVVTSANVACGFHAGDPTTMLATCRAGSVTPCRMRSVPFSWCGNMQTNGASQRTKWELPDHPQAGIWRLHFLPTTRKP